MYRQELKPLERYFRTFPHELAGTSPFAKTKIVCPFLPLADIIG
jgi:hypothetical protein